MIDASGFRKNIGIILANDLGQVFWAKRLRQEAWQFPQGGMHSGENPDDTLYRELTEEIGLKESDVSILGRTHHWLHYRIPKRFIRDSKPRCIGQKQLWYLLKLESNEGAIHFEGSHKPEFDGWRWVSYWFPIRSVVPFKREVYRRALKELSPYLFENAVRSRDLQLLSPILSDDEE